MSYEQSMQALAESNIKLAASLDRYAETLDKYAGNVVSLATGKPISESTAADTTASDAKADKPKATRGKAKPEPVTDTKADDGFDDDGLGDDLAPALDFDAVKAKLLEVRDKFNDKSHALKIIEKFGYKGMPEIGEKDYAAIYKACEKRLAE